MKKFSILLIALFGANVALNAQQTITQSTDPVNITPGGVSCGGDGSTSYNVFSRAFTLADYGITTDFNVTSVSFGLEEITGTLPFWVAISSVSGGTYPAGTVSEIYGQSFDISAGSATAQEFVFDSPALVPAGTGQIVFSYESDGTADAVGFYPGSNAAGESAPSYITAPECGLNTPGTFGSVGFPNVHLVMSVTGTTDMGTVELNSRSLNVYPNPATDIVNISLKDGNAQSIEVSNLAGQNVMSSKAVNSLNVSFLPAGVYVVKVKDNSGKVHMTKLVKK